MASHPSSDDVSIAAAAEPSPPVSNIVMQLRMLDRIVALEPGVQIRAQKRLRADEEYLKDHFPNFPVMPGVLMLEALFQAAMWLVRATDNFQHSIVFLCDARNVRYNGFVAPGQVLEVTCELSKLEGDRAKVKAQGVVEGNPVVSGRLELLLANLSDKVPGESPRDRFACNWMRHEFERLYMHTAD